jgi:hypothetical protein
VQPTFARPVSLVGCASLTHSTYARVARFRMVTNSTYLLSATLNLWTTAAGRGGARVYLHLLLERLSNLTGCYASPDPINRSKRKATDETAVPLLGASALIRTRGRVRLRPQHKRLTIRELDEA